MFGVVAVEFLSLYGYAVVAEVVFGVVASGYVDFVGAFLPVCVGLVVVEFVGCFVDGTLFFISAITIPLFLSC